MSRETPAGRRVAHRAKQNLAHVLDRLDRPLGADHVTALAFLNLARAHRRVRGAQPGEDLAHGEAEAGELQGIDLDPKLAPAGAVDIHPADARDVLQPLLDHVLHELAEGVDRALVPGLGADDHPGDRVVLAPRGPKLGLSCFRGISRYSVEAVCDEKQRLVHVHVDAELEGNPCAPVPGRAVHGGEPLEALERLLLAIDDLALDFGRRAAPPARRHDDDRTRHVRSELDGNGAQRERAEHGDHEDGGDDRPGTFDGMADEVHAWPLSSGAGVGAGAGSGPRIGAGAGARAVPGARPDRGFPRAGR